MSAGAWAVCWSGGKDCCLAHCRADASGMDIRWLISIVSGRPGRRNPHLVELGVLQAQADAVGAELLAEQAVGYGGYDGALRRAVKQLLPHGLRGVICGDIQQWGSWMRLRRICEPFGVAVNEPLLGASCTEVLEMCLDLGIRAVIITAGKTQFPEDITGHELDRGLVRELLCRNDLDASGEEGEYHTLVLDAPTFEHSLVIAEAASAEGDRYWALHVSKLKRAISEE